MRRRHRWPSRPPDLAVEIARWAPDVADLTHAKRLTYDVRTNWKNVIDNFRECYHCHIAHKVVVSLVDMNTDEVRTHGIWSSHFAEGNHDKAAYGVSGATGTRCGLFHLGAGAGGLAAFCERYSDSFNRWWDDLGRPHLDPGTTQKLVDGLKSTSARRSTTSPPNATPSSAPTHPRRAPRPS